MSSEFTPSGLTVGSKNASFRQSAVPSLADKDFLIQAIFEVQHSMALEGQAISENDLNGFIDESLIRLFVQTQQLR